MIIILEGLPKVGKTTLINYIKELNIDGIYTVDELIINTKELDQDTFINNDTHKINKYNEGLIVIDKGPISTLSYNEMLYYLNNNKDLYRVRKWFNEVAIPFYKRDDVYTIYLKSNKKRFRERGINKPHGSINNQNIMQEITINNIKKYCKNYEIINYEYKEMENFVNEIINKYM